MKNECRAKTIVSLLQVADTLTENNIVFFPAGATKPQIFEKLIDTLKLPDPRLALQAILDRERWGTTVIAPGLALPHARIPGLPRIFIAIGLCPGTAPEVVVLFLSPAEAMAQHLSFLARVSALFQAKGMLESLISLKTPEEILAQLRKTEKSL